MLIKIEIPSKDGLARMLIKALPKTKKVEEAGHEVFIDFSYSGKYGHLKNLFKQQEYLESPSCNYNVADLNNKTKEIDYIFLWEKYFKLHESINPMFLSMTAKLGHNYTAVHIRRADAWGRHPFVPTSVIINKIKNETKNKIYVATDSSFVAESAKSIDNVFVSDFYRYDEKNKKLKGTHYMAFELNTMDRAGVEAILDINLLSMAGLLFGGKSNMTQLATIIGRPKTFKNIFDLNLFKNKEQYNEYLNIQSKIVNGYNDYEFHIESIIEKASSVEEALDNLKAAVK